MTCNVNPHILRYIEIVENGEVRACAEQKQLVALVRRAFETEDIYTDDEQIEKYLGLAKYFPYDEVFPWEPICICVAYVYIPGKRQPPTLARPVFADWTRRGQGRLYCA